MTIETAAWGVHSVATANMAAAVREMTMGKGLDPRGLPLVVGGGAGALHGAEIAESLGFADVLVPWDAGVLCAFGMVGSDIRYDKTVSLVRPVDTEFMQTLPGVLARTKADLADRIRPVAQLLESCNYSVEFELRYQGQFHELAVSMPETALSAGEPRPIVMRFGDTHLKAYGFKVDGAVVEIVDLRVSIIGKLRRDPTAQASSLPIGVRRTSSRRILTGDGWADAGVFTLTTASDGVSEIDGPALTDLPTTTVLIPHGWKAFICPAVLHLKPDGSR